MPKFIVIMIGNLRICKTFEQILKCMWEAYYKTLAMPLQNQAAP
jgi:hypothetical protein